MDFDHINYFLILAETLNYSKAAEQLHITQPTLTKCINRIEAEYNKQLFYRNNRNVSLTPDGEIVKQYFQKILNDNNALIDELSATKKEEIQYIRVGFLSHTMHQYFPTFIRRFTKQHPNVRIHLIDGDQSTQIDAYQAGQLDVYIGTEGAREALSHQKVRKLNEEKIYLMVPSDSVYAKQETVDLNDLKEAVFIILGNTISYLSPLYNRNNLTLKMCAEHQFTPKFITCRSFTNIPLMVACNMGIAIVTKAADFYGGERITFVPIKDHENDVLVTNAYYDEYKKSVVEMFVGELEAYIKEKNSKNNNE